MLKGVTFFTGIGEKYFNHHEVYTGLNACVSPVTGRGGILKKDGKPVLDRYGNPKKKKQRENQVSIPADVTTLIYDCGAYSDTTYYRLSDEESLERQLAHMRKYNAIRPDRKIYIASHDLLVDEQANAEGEREKNRMNPDLAVFAVRETIKAAEYINGRRDYIAEQTGQPAHLIISAQGSDADQYLYCSEKILPFINPDTDIFGLGGWCILGRQTSLMATYRETISRLVPLLKRWKIKKIHIWGVCYAPALCELIYAINHDEYGNPEQEKNLIEISCDSVGPTTRITKPHKRNGLHSAYGYSSWRNNNYLIPPVLDSCRHLDENGNKAPTCSPSIYCRGNERKKHVIDTTYWLANIVEREPDLYKPIQIEQPKQEDDFTQLLLFA